MEIITDKVSRTLETKNHVETLEKKLFRFYKDSRAPMQGDFEYVARDYFRIFFETTHLFDMINLDAIVISCKGFKGVNKKRVELAYGNLYSYVLADGIVIPYYDWTFEREFSCKLANGVRVKYNWNKDGTFQRTTML